MLSFRFGSQISCVNSNSGRLSYSRKNPVNVKSHFVASSSSSFCRSLSRRNGRLQNLSVCLEHLPNYSIRTAYNHGVSCKARSQSPSPDNGSDPSQSVPPEFEWDVSEKQTRKNQVERLVEIQKDIGKIELGDSNRFDLNYEVDEASDEEMDVVQDEILGIVSKVPRKKPPSRSPGEKAEPPRTISAAPLNEAIPSPVKVEPQEEEEEDEWEEEEEEEEEEELSLDGAITLDESDFEDFDGPPPNAEEQAPDEMDPVYRMPLGDLLESSGVEPLVVDGSLDVTITGIQHDSREVSPGDLFVCCPGATHNGHHFVKEAIERGAVAIVVSEEVDLSEAAGSGSSSSSGTSGVAAGAVVMVDDSLAALSALSNCLYGRPSEELLVVGITGTNGKSTTAWLVRSIYTAMGLKAGMLGTIQHSIDSTEIESTHTTPDALELHKLLATMVHKRCEACVMEVSSHALVQGRTADVDIDVAVFTNLTRDHLDFHGSMEDYCEAKLLMFDAMRDPDRHRKVVNLDDPRAPLFLQRGNPEVPTVTFALESKEADVYPLHVALSLFETELVVRTPRGVLEMSSGLIGRHNVSNILAAVSVGLAIEAPLEDIVRGVEEVDAVPGRCELVDEEQSFAVLVDYAHSPDALERLLDTVRECAPNRIITVLGCGGDRDRGKRPIMCKIATDMSDVTILTSDNPRNEDPLAIIDDMLAGVGWSMAEYLERTNCTTPYVPTLPNGHKLFVHDIRGVAVRSAVAMGEDGDAVVVAGKGHETYQIVKGEKDYFDDREECREALLHMEELQIYFDTSEIPFKLKPEYCKKYKR